MELGVGRSSTRNTRITERQPMQCEEDARRKGGDGYVLGTLLEEEGIRGGRDPPKFGEEFS